MTNLYRVVVLAGLVAWSAGALGESEAPAEVVGRWRFGSINPVTYWDKSTGAYLGSGGGTSCVYEFDKDGAYRMYLLFKTNNSGWIRTVWTQEEGTATWAGDKVTLTPRAGKFKVVDNRSKKDNYERPINDDELKKHTKTVKWARERKDGKEVFVTGGEGKDPRTEYWREEGEKK
ncbi:MAG TPA: hypothetical protein VEA69_10210 [Tepidisphaeraceae bacterium]|nr:hypothetical protein [Tepidisphaeraceae bacterium]